MSSWSNIVAKKDKVVAKKNKTVLVKKEKNYDKEIDELKKQQFFNDNYESKIDNLYNKIRDEDTNQSLWELYWQKAPKQVPGLEQ